MSRAPNSRATRVFAGVLLGLGVVVWLPMHVAFAYLTNTCATDTGGCSSNRAFAGYGSFTVLFGLFVLWEGTRPAARGFLLIALGCMSVCAWFILLVTLRSTPS